MLRFFAAINTLIAAFAIIGVAIMLGGSALYVLFQPPVIGGIIAAYFIILFVRAIDS